MAQDLIAFIEQVAGPPVDLACYSDGATVATLVALRRPDLIRRLVLVSGGFHPSGWIVLPDADARGRSGDLAHASRREARVVRQVDRRLPDHRSRAHAGADPPPFMSHRGS
jgi:pimeloyl-ACP methyl ester carboxylesterase